MRPRTGEHPHLAFYQEVPPQEIDALKKNAVKSAKLEESESTASTAHIFWPLNRRVWFFQSKFPV